jgi:hypothetical protein
MVISMYGFQSHQCHNCFQQLIRATSSLRLVKASLRYLERAVYMWVCVPSRVTLTEHYDFRAIWQEAGSGYSWPWNDTLFCDPVCAVEHFTFDWSHPVVLSESAKGLFHPVRTQQILYYQSINLATCFGSLSHHEANSQTTLKVHSVNVHIVGSKMFTIVRQ